MACWNLKKLDLDSPKDSSSIMDNFIKESKSYESILVRELLQNTLDARVESETNNSKAYVTIREIETDIAQGDKWLSEIKDFVKKSSAAPSKIDFNSSRALVIEEFHTTGLTGNTSDPRAEGEEQRWANFWHCEGVRNKTGKSLGRAGQGKITYFMSSMLNSVFALTKRYDDNKTYLYGKCILDNCPKINNTYYHRHHLWGEKNEKTQAVMPVTDEKQIESFKNTFSIKRTNESGTSFVIPMHVHELEKDKLVRAILEDFYYPILKEHLIVSVENIEINSVNLEELINQYLSIYSQPSISYLKFLKSIAEYEKGNIYAVDKNWTNETSLKEAYFNEEELEIIKKDFSEGKIVCANFPITVTPKAGDNQQGNIIVFLQKKEDIKETEELFIRSELVIGDEKKLRNVAGKSFGLVLIDDPVISEFLGYAEEASHMKWNAKEREVQKRYSNVQQSLLAIRQAMPRFYKMLDTCENDVLEHLFDDILSIPNEKSSAKKKQKKTQQKDNSATPTGNVPEHERQERFFDLYDLDYDHGVGMRDSKKITAEMLPLTGSLEIAYDRLDGEGDPFKHWHPFDFDFLANKNQFKIKTSGVKIKKREENIITFTVTECDFNVEVSGFNRDQYLKSKGTLRNE